MGLTLGIDIGKRRVRGAVLRTSMRVTETERYLEVPVHHINEEGENPANVASAIAELIRSMPTPPDAVIVSIDGSRASLRNVTIPAAAKKRAHEVLPFELESLLPFGLDETVVDYQEVGELNGQVTLLTAAVPEGVVAELLETLGTQQVSPREIAVGAAALDALSAALPPGTDDPVVFVDLAEQHTDVCVVRGGVCELARTLDFGIDALSGQPASLRSALHQTVMKYRADGGPLPARVLVSGDGSYDENLVSWIGSSLNLEAAAIQLPSAKTSTEPPPATFAKAWALAARTGRRGKRLDLRRGKFALPRGVSQLRDYALLAAACTLAIICSYVFSTWTEYKVLAEERDALALELEKVTERHFGAGTKSPQQAKELLESGAKVKDPLPRFDAFKALAAISAAVPEGVPHDTRKVEVQLDEVGQTGKFEINAQIPDLGARDQVVAALDANDCLGDLEPGKISSVPGQDKKNYTLEGVIACPGAIPEGGKAKAKAKAKAKRDKGNE